MRQQFHSEEKKADFLQALVGVRKRLLARLEAPSGTLFVPAKAPERDVDLLQLTGVPCGKSSRPGSCSGVVLIEGRHSSDISPENYPQL